jgi:hypothetical protein
MSASPLPPGIVSALGAALFVASEDASHITGDVSLSDGEMLPKQRSATDDIRPPADLPKVEDL